MQNHNKVYLTTAVLLLGLLAWWLLHWMLREPPGPAKGPTSVVQQNTTSASPTVTASGQSYPSEQQIQSFLASHDRTPEELDLLKKNPGVVGKYMIFLAARDAVNSQEINYYGRLVDQDGNPVVGARVNGNVMLVGGFDNSPVKTYTTYSDAAGLFEFTGLHGESLGISPQKEGYEVNPGGYRAPNAADKSSPIERAITVMYKLSGAEPTITDDKFWGIIPDGRVFTIDLLKSKKTESAAVEGDLRVSIQRPATAKRNDRYDWSFSIEAIDGGLVQTNDPYLNEAPETGYQPRFTYTAQADSPQWSNSFAGVFYVKSRDGKVYGHIKVEVTPVYQQAAAVSIQSLVNPAGSRNLEFDRAKQVKPQ